MRIIGLCGMSGAGKSTVADLFREYGFYPIDTDAIYHTLISAPSECTDELVKVFSGVILNELGCIDRRKLADIVFKDKDKLLVLNKIAHKHVLDCVRKTISTLDENLYTAAIVDAPLLFESGFDKECDAIIAVVADIDTKASRIVKRDNITYERAVERLRNQIPDDTIISRSTYVIRNNDSDDVKGAVREIANIINNLK